MGVREMRQFLALAGRAHCRYPDVELPLAIRFLESDMLRAGLGALRPQSRFFGDVRNTKEQDLLTRDVVYCMSIVRLPRMQAPTLHLVGPVSLGRGNMSATITAQRIPGVDLRVRMAVDPRDLRDPERRNVIARQLLHMRRELRAEVARVEAGGV